MPDRSSRSPYRDMPSSAFWKTAVAAKSPETLTELYKKKFAIDRTTQIATAGSCFAQHIARNLRARGYSVIDEEPSPRGLSEEAAGRFGYNTYSARYGNIYTARQLRQLLEEVAGAFAPSDCIWRKDDRFYDALRPSVEPGGLATEGLVVDHRQYHLRQVKKAFCKADVLVFTLGLTEAWEHIPSGTIYPTAPGTIAGSYDPAMHGFRNFTFLETYGDLTEAFRLCHAMNPGMRFMLTVSPVPLAATAASEHVLSATTYSKSVLRAVAGQLCKERADVDYVPAYEVITSALSKAAYFEDNLRSVRQEGVDAVMKMFFAEHDSSLGDEAAVADADLDNGVQEIPDDEGDVQCDEILLEAFAP